MLAIATGIVKPRRRLSQAESIEQRLFVRRFRLDRRTRDLPACAIPNGGKRGKAEAARLKAEGVSAGAPDWVLFAHGILPGACIVGLDGSESSVGDQHFIGLALEFKNPDGTGVVSAAQKAWHRKLRDAGWRVEVVETSLAAWQILCQYLNIEAT